MWVARTLVAGLGLRRVSAVVLGFLIAWLVVTALDLHGLTQSDGTRAHVASESPEIPAGSDAWRLPAHSHYNDGSAHIHPGPATQAGTPGGGSSFAAASERRALAGGSPLGLIRSAGPHPRGEPPPLSPAQLQVLRS